MQRFSGSLAIVATALLAFAQTSMAQSMTRTGSALVPQSSIEQPQDIGVRSHTNLMFEVVHGSPGQGLLKPNQMVGNPPFPNYAYETPASLACIYRLVPSVAGCNPNDLTQAPSGGSQTIAVVDAYDDPNAMSDLNSFSSQFGLPQVTASTFQVVYASGTQPTQDPTGDWEGEESLDIEMAHAMAPNATIILVEAASNLNSDLYPAVNVASEAVTAANGGTGSGEVLMDWGESEYDFTGASDETLNDVNFTPPDAPPGVVYISSTGDDPGTEYPSVSPYVVAVGGTTVRRNLFAGGNTIGQVAWQDAGGGPSLYEPRPSFQNGVKSVFPASVRAFRGVPDLSFDSDPNSGAWIYDSTPMTDIPGGGVSGTDWYIFGGTSLGAAAVAGIINASGHVTTSSTSTLELTKIYNHMTITTDYHDITSGTCGPYDSYSAAAGWDYCTGVGIPRGYVGK